MDSYRKKKNWDDKLINIVFSPQIVITLFF